MTSLDELMIASAVANLDMDDYWPASASDNEINTDDGREDLIHFDFYDSLLDYLLQDRRVTPNSMRVAFLQLENNGQTACRQTLREPNYNLIPNCLAYLLKYAACHAALVHSAMIKIFHASPPAAIRRMLYFKDKLSVMCLGSGPGNDLVGLLSALYGKHYGLLNLDVTAVDKMIGWKDVFLETERLLRKGDHGNASKILKEIAVNVYFVEADLQTPLSWSKEFENKLSAADIITLVEVFSFVPDANKYEVLKNVVFSMKFGSVLVFIDSVLPFAEFFALELYGWIDVVFIGDVEKFISDFYMERFGCESVTTSSAYVRVLVKKFIGLNTGQSEDDD